MVALNSLEKGFKAQYVASIDLVDDGERCMSGERDAAERGRGENSIIKVIHGVIVE